MTLITFVGDHQVQSLKQLFDLSANVPNDEQTIYVNPLVGISADSQAHIAKADTLILQTAATAFELDLDELNPTASRHYLPKVTADFLWPFGGQAHVRNFATSRIPGRVFTTEFGDAYLNRQLVHATDAEQVVQSYCNLDVSRVIDIDLYLRLFIQQQERLDPDAKFDIPELILRNFRSESLFRSPSQPGKKIINHLARILFSGMGVSPERLRKISEHAGETNSEGELPIHPSIARHFELQWVGEDHIYQFTRGQHVSFREYVRRYVIYNSDTDLEEGLYLSEIGHPLRAIEKLRCALARSPRSFCGHYSMCKALAKVGEVQKAIEHLRIAIEIEPNDPLPRTALSLLLTQSAQPMDAELELRTALILDPLSHDCHYKLGCFLSKKGELDEAEFSLKRANELRPGKAMYERALCLHYAKSGNITEAIASAKRLSKLLPQNPHSHAYMGHLLANSGDLHGAEHALRVAVSLDARVALFRELLAQVLRRQGRIEDATAEAEIGRALALTNKEAANQLAAEHVGAR